MNVVSAVTPPYASIGEVLSQLRPEFPDTTISKLRFLESEGLVEPERTPAGYRKYSDQDIARLRYVLTAQRDHYLPLKVIREHLNAMDGGVIRATPMIPDAAPNPATTRLTRGELKKRADINDELLAHLEQFGLITADIDGMFAEHDITIAEAAAGLSGYGIEPRHIKAFRGAVDREIGLYSQIVAPLTRRRSYNRNPDQQGAQARARDAAAHMCQLSTQLHAALLQSAMHRVLQQPR